MGGEHRASGRRKPRRSKHFRSTWEGTGYDAYMDVAELPSKPDPLTGQPRPPRAPVPIGLFSKEKEEKPLKEHDADREHDRRWCPSPPGGEGPLLEWYRASRWNALRSAAVLTLILFVGLCGEQLGFAWMAYWFPWGFILGGGLFMYFRQRWKCFAAGAEWLKVRDNWVRLYELTRIECGGRSGGGIRMWLEDSSGRRVAVQVEHLYQDGDLWDLVFSGMAHSALAEAAETNSAAHRTLGVPRRNDSLFPGTK